MDHSAWLSFSAEQKIEPDMCVDGKYQNAMGAERIASVNPANGSLVAHIADASLSTKDRNF